MSNTISIELVVNDQGSIVVKRLVNVVGEASGQIHAHAQKTSSAISALRGRFEGLSGQSKTAYNALASLALPIIALNQVFSTLERWVVKIKDIFWSLIGNATTLGDQLQTLSVRTGMSVETLSVLRVAAQMSGSSLGEVASGLRALQDRAVMAAQGIGEPKRAFEMLGISVRSTSGGMKTADELFFEVADKLGRVKDATLRTKLAMDLLGSSMHGSGASLIPLLEKLAGRKREVIQYAERLGVVFTKISAEAAGKMQNALTALQYAQEGVKNTLANALIPVMIPFIERMIDVAIAMRAWIDANKELIQTNIASWITTSMDAINSLLPIVARLADLIRRTAEGWAYLFGWGKSAAALEFDIRQRLQLGFTTPAALEDRLEAVQNLIDAQKAELQRLQVRPPTTIEDILSGRISVRESKERAMRIAESTERIKELQNSIEHLSREETALLNVQTALDKGLLDFGKSAKSTTTDLTSLLSKISELNDAQVRALQLSQFRKEGLTTDKQIYEFQLMRYAQEKALIDIEEDREALLQDLQKAQEALYKVEDLKIYADVQKEISEGIFEIRERQMFLNEVLGEANAAYMGLEGNLKNLNMEARKTVDIFSGMLDVLGAFSGVLTALGINIGGVFQRVLSALSAFQNLGNTIARLAGQAGGTTGLFGAGGLLGRGRCNVITTKYKRIRSCPELPSYCAGVIISAL